MKNSLPFFLIAILFSNFTFKTENASDLSYELSSLIRSFASNANKSSCANYLSELEELEDRISKAKRDGEATEQSEYSNLEKRARTFHEFAETLTRCSGTSNELDLNNFNAFLDETGLAPILVKRNGCAAIYRVNINGFPTYYAVNASSASKSLKIAVAGSTFTMNIMCNSVEGFSQGESLRTISSAVVTCKAANLTCY